MMTFAALAVWLWTRKTGTRWSWGRLSIANSGIGCLKIVSDLKLSLTQDLGNADNELAQEKAPSRGAMIVAFPCDLCSNLQSNVKFGPRIWHFLHFLARDPVFLASWSELSQILKKWVLWVILWYFSVFPKLCVLAVDGYWLHKFPNNSLWPIPATLVHNHAQITGTHD